MLFLAAASMKLLIIVTKGLEIGVLWSDILIRVW